MSKDQVQKLFKSAFDQPRNPRSGEYKAGVLSALAFKFNGIPVKCPYALGTARADAFFAGLDEGYLIWRNATKTT